MARTPDFAEVKDKMITASSQVALQGRLNGIAAEIRGTDYSEVAYEIGELFPSSPALPIYLLP